MNFSPVFLGLGTNIGDLEENLFLAISGLISHPHIRIEQISPTYRTQPKYQEDQPYFLNLVVKISTCLKPVPLLLFCKRLEQKMGRDLNSRKRNGPRIIDIDIEFYDHEIIETSLLTVPHPALYERKFVLQPLVDIAPDFNCPVKKISVKELLNGCQDNSRVESYESSTLSNEKSVLHRN